MNVKEFIEDYCYKNYEQKPETDDEYIAYASRLLRVSAINQNEFDAFVELLTKLDD